MEIVKILLENFIDSNRNFNNLNKKSDLDQKREKGTRK